MSDVIEIITKLTYQVEDADLQKSAQALQANINNVITLTANLEKLQTKQKATAASDIKAQTDIQVAINNTTKAIDKQIGEIEKTVKSNDRLKAAVQSQAQVLKAQTTAHNTASQAITTSGKASNYATQELLNFSRIASDAPYGLIGIANNISPAVEGFQRLSAAAKESGTSVGSELLNAFKGAGGLLFIINAATSLLLVFGSALTSSTAATEKQTDALTNLNDGLVTSIEKQREYNRILKEGTALDEDAAKRALDLAKSRGIINGEVFNKEKSDFESEKKYRQDRSKDIQSEITDIQTYQQRVATALDVIERRRSEGNDVALNPTTEKGRKEALRQLNEQLDIYEQKLPESIKKTVNLGEVLDQVYKDTDPSNVSFNNAATKISEQFTLATTTVTKKKAENDNDLLILDNEFNNKIRERRYQLNKELIEANITLNKEIREGQIENYHSLFGDQIALIKAKSDLDREAALHAVDLAQQEARKTGALNRENRIIFNEERKRIQQSSNDDYLRQSREFYEALRIRQAQYAVDAIKTDLDIAKRTLNIDIETSHDTLAQREQIAIDERDIALAEIDIKYSALLKKEIVGEENYNRVLSNYADERGLIEQEAGRKQIKAQEDFYSKRKSDLEKALKLELDTNRANGVMQSKIAQDRIKKAEAEQELQNALSERGTLLNNGVNTSSADFKANQQRIEDARNKIRDLNRDIKKDQLELAKSIENAYLTITQSIVNALNTVYAAQQKQLDQDIHIQERRVNEALILAERGNTESLRLEQERLDELDKKRAESVKKQVQANALLGLSNSAVALTDAVKGVLGAAANTTEGGAVSYIAAIVAGFAAVAGLYASVSTLAQSQKGFKTGGYTGDGDANTTAGVVHKGEFVMTKERTSQFRPLLEAMHSGKPMVNYGGSSEGYASKKEMQAIAGKLDTLIEVTDSNRTAVHTNIDESGVHQIVERQNSLNKRKWG